jgi:hypothetical protein
MGDLVLARQPTKPKVKISVDISAKSFFIDTCILVVDGLFCHVFHKTSDQCDWPQPPPVQSGFLFSTKAPGLQLTPSGDEVLARHPAKVIMAKAIEISNPNLFISKTFQGCRDAF